MNDNSKYFYVYKITNSVNGKIYIGKSNSNKNRFKDHLNIAKNKYKSSFSYLHKAICKYGEDSFLYEIIEIFDLEDDAYDAETKYITQFKSNNRDYGYNLNTGGLRSYTMNDDVKSKISKKKTGFKFSEDSILKMKKSHLGVSPANKKFDDQTVKEIRKIYSNSRFLKENLTNVIKSLSSKFNCSEHCIKGIVYNINYKNIPYEEEVCSNEKVCSKCKRVLHLEQFNKDRRSKDGLCGRCRLCEKEYRSKRVRK